MAEWDLEKEAKERAIKEGRYGYNTADGFISLNDIRKGQAAIVLVAAIKKITPSSLVVQQMIADFEKAEAAAPDAP